MCLLHSVPNQLFEQSHELKNKINTQCVVNGWFPILRRIKLNFQAAYRLLIVNYSLSDCDHIILVTGWGANMGVITDDAISQLEQIRRVLVSLLVLLPNLKLKGLNLCGVLSFLINKS